MVTRSRSAAVLAALALSTLPAFAQDGVPGPGPAEPAAQAPSTQAGKAGEGQTNYRLAAGAAHQFSTDFDDSNGSFSMSRFGLSAGVSYPIDHVLVGHALTYEYDAYDFSDAAPWDDSHLLSYTLNLSHRLSDNWSLFGGPIIGAIAESGADWSDAITYGANVGLRRQFSKDLAIGIGVIATSGIEEGASVLPLILIDWRLSDRLSVRNGRPQPGLRGTAGAELAYEIAPRFTLAAGFAYDRRRFRLDDEGVAPDGVGENTSFPVYLRAGYDLNDHWSVGALAGVLLGGELRLEDEDGHELDESDYDTAPFVGVSAAYTF